MRRGLRSCIAMVCAALAIGVTAAACGGVSQDEHDQQAAKLADTEAQLAGASERVSSLETERERLIDPGTVAADASQLFKDLNAAVQSADGAALYDLVDSGLRSLCTVDEFEGLFSDQEIPAIGAEVDRVYLDAESPDRALVRLRATGQVEGEFEAAALLLPALSLPIVKEDDAWRLSFPFMEILESDLLPFLTGDDIPCPAALGALGETAFEDAVFEEREVQVAAPVDAPAGPGQRGTTREFGSGDGALGPPPAGARLIGASEGAGTGLVESSALLETDLSTEAVFGHYWDQVLQPEWTPGDDTGSEDFKTVSWEFRDADGNAWSGVLVVIAAGDRHIQANLLMVGGLPPE